MIFTVLHRFRVKGLTKYLRKFRKLERAKKKSTSKIKVGLNKLKSMFSWTRRRG